MSAEVFRKQKNDKESIDSLGKFFMEGNTTLALSERNSKILFESIGLFLFLFFFKQVAEFVPQQLKIRCAAKQLYTYFRMKVHHGS